MSTYFGTKLIKQINDLVVSPGCLAIWGLGQMGVALKGSHQKILYIDPILTDAVTRLIPDVTGHFERAFDPPLQPEEITNADYVLCTHEHLDHTDPLTLGPLAISSPQARFISSGWVESLLDDAKISLERRIRPEMNTYTVLDDMRVWGVPAAHYKVEFSQDKGYRWLSYLISWGDVTFFHGGDTLLYPGYMETIRQLPPVDVGLLAVNGRDAVRESEGVLGNMLPDEAAWMANALKWDVLLGGHNDLFAWNTLPAGSLMDAVRHQALHQKVHVLQPGELYYYVR
jgi:L-ascorbate 6-phosphate lactonase